MSHKPPQQRYSNNYAKASKNKQSAPQPNPALASTAAGKENPLPLASATPAAPPTSGTQTLPQQRAKYALEQVQSAMRDGVDPKEFKSYASGFPAMIQMNGLGQAAAFYLCQGGTHKRLYDLLSGWLCQARQPYAAHGDLLEGVTRCDMHGYRIAQAEALLLLDWVKKFAKAYMREA